MSLNDYLRNGWIRAHQPSADEIRDIFSVIDRDLRDSGTPQLSPEWKFDIAYNAALQAATAALAAAGCRAQRTNKHMRTLESLEFTVGLAREEVAYLDTCRRKRHVAVYERVGAISDGEARELLEFSGELRNRVQAWLQQKHPELMP